METIRGFLVKQRKGLSHWEALLEEWLLINERYCRIMDGEDALFIYTERALIGTIAGAAWRCGRVALEEFQCEKGYKNKPKRYGRADLYIASEINEEQIEAKYRWVSLASKNISSIAAGALTEAVRDAKQTQVIDGEALTIGVAFLPMYLPASKEIELENRIHDAILEIKKEVDFHAAAWFFPENFRKDTYKKNFRPGIALLAANAKYA